MNDATPGTGDASTELVPVEPTPSAFDFLLRSDVAAPVDEEPGEGVQRPTAFDFSDRPEREVPKASPLEWASLALAVVLPPLGLVLSVVAGFIARRAHGWTTWVAKTATVVGAILTVVLVAGGLVFTAVGNAEAADAKIVADSAAFCAALDETPGVLDQPGFGWPTDRSAIPETIVGMQAYLDRWTSLTDVAPAGVRPGVRSVANAAQSLLTAVQTNQAIDRDRNLSDISSVTKASGVPQYVAKYCRS